MQVQVGDNAPQFSVSDHNDTVYSLDLLKGNWVFLYFYPKDNTPGCTQEACTINDVYDDLQKLGVIVLGVSADSKESHQQFAQKYTLNFPLLVDTDKQLVQAYGATGLLFPKRVSFLIDPKGIIRKVYPSVDPQVHAQEVLLDVKNLIT